MRTGRHVRAAPPGETVREVFVGLAGPRRRSGAVLIVDEAERLARDLHRQRPRPALRDTAARPTARPADRRGHDAPTRSRSSSGATVAEAVEAMKARKISELPVVDRGGRLVGLIDLTDLIGLVPAEIEE